MNLPIAAAYRRWESDKLQQLERAEFLSRAELLELQQARLKQVIEYCYQNVPYYHELLLDYSVVNGATGVVDLSAYSKLPYLDKNLIHKNFDKLKSQQIRSGQKTNFSGGSTGAPGKFMQDKDFRSWVRATKILFDSWAAYQFGDPRIVLWASERDLQGQKRGAWWRPFLRKLKGELWLNAYRMSAESIRSYVHAWNEHKPSSVLGYAESLYELSRFIQDENLQVSAPRSILSSAGTLFPDMRQVIEQNLGAPIFNRYGSREAGEMASECPQHQGLHSNPLTHWIEILGDDGKARSYDLAAGSHSSRGEIIVTSLVNLSMPLLRYRIGDEASWADGSCACGREWPRLETVHGRVTDNLISQLHGKIYGGYFRFILNEMPWLSSYQIVQTDLDRLKVYLVEHPNHQIPKHQIKQAHVNVSQTIKAKMGERTQVDIDVVDELMPSPSGKFRHVICQISNQ